jgi:hypothetical protein
MHEGYIPRWLTQSEQWDLPVLKLRCITFLNTGSAEDEDKPGVAQGLQLSLNPSSPHHVIKMLQLAHNLGHDKYLVKPLIERCTTLIRTAASGGLLSSVVRVGQEHYTAASASPPSGAMSSSHRPDSSSLVHQPLVEELLHGTCSAHEHGHRTRSSSAISQTRSVLQSATGRLGNMRHDPAVRHGWDRPSGQATESEPCSKAAGTAAGDAASRIEGLAALADGLLMRLSSQEQVGERSENLRSRKVGDSSFL